MIISPNIQHNIFSAVSPFFFPEHATVSLVSSQSSYPVISYWFTQVGGQERLTLKIPQLRNMDSKVGMFGMPDVQFFKGGNNGHQGDQIRGFGFLHDGSTDTLLRFLNAELFTFPNGSGGDTTRKQVEQFLFAFDSNLKPAVGQQVSLHSDTSQHLLRREP